MKRSASAVIVHLSRIGRFHTALPRPDGATRQRICDECATPAHEVMMAETHFTAHHVKMVAQIITIMTPRPHGRRATADAGETGSVSYRRQRFGHAEEELKPAGARRSTSRPSSPVEEKQPWAKNASASKHRSTQSRIFMPALAKRQPRVVRRFSASLTGRMRLGPIDIRIITRQVPRRPLAAFLDTQRESEIIARCDECKRQQGFPRSHKLSRCEVGQPRAVTFAAFLIGPPELVSYEETTAVPCESGSNGVTEVRRQSNLLKCSIRPS